MTLDTTMRPLATKLLNRFGAAIAYTFKTAPAYDPSTGVGSSTAVATSFNAYPEVYKGQWFFSDLIKAGDLKLNAPGEAFATPPEPGDTFIFESKTYTVLAVKPIYSGELVALFEIAGRK